MNATRLKLDVEFVQGDLLDGIECQAVLANLPYIADNDLLQPDVAWYEPQEALLGGPDGLDVIRRLLAQVASRPEIALVALEIGSAQGEAVSSLVAKAGFDSVERLRDLAGLERVIVGRR
jgi:release factor glutamine methyltransferase